VKFGAGMHIRLPNMTVYQKFQYQRWQMAAILKIKNRDISETIWPILMKFGTAMHIGPPNLKVDE